MPPIPIRAPLRPEMTVRQAAADLPGCREVFARYGEPDRPGVKFGHLEPIERFARRHGVAPTTLLAELAAAAETTIELHGPAERNAHRPFVAAALICTLSLLSRGTVTARSSLKTLLAEHPALEDELIAWGFGYVARTRAVPGELTIGSFVPGEGQDPIETVNRINRWLSERH